MSERQRRSYVRKLRRGDVEEAEELAKKVEDGGWSEDDDENNDIQELTDTDLFDNEEADDTKEESTAEE